MTEHDSENKINEPAAFYNSIRKSTYEGLEEENRVYSLGLTPEQRMAYLMELNINAFGRQSLQIEDPGNKIYKG
jgi:hypothetical protein